MNDQVKRLAEFHGHLGPYLIVGMKMGELSNTLLGKETGAGSTHFVKKAIVKTGTTPPISCIIDGIQFTSGCTLGKGNIEILNEKIPEATFILNDKQLTLKLKINIETANRQVEDVALEIYETAWQDLFELSKNFE
ncbi:MAG TPA: formylmethanofuran dehydrogenase subunit E family protein [Candidatus Deferrimicrobium sp.]|nr:formylmethanofuran dehydrogenase subunit E family protein [Candidatus Deferrimicrobium sp.]